MATSLSRSSILCRQCLRVTRQTRLLSAQYSTQPQTENRTGNENGDLEEAGSKSKQGAQEKEPGSLARRLEEATEEALFTGGRAGRRAIEDAGFSEELKEKLLAKIANTNFKNEHAGAFSQAEMPASAGEGTKHMAAAQPWTGQESTADGVLRMLDDAKKPLAPGLRSKFQAPPVDMRLQREPTRSPGQKVASARDRASLYVGMDMKSKNAKSEEEREAYRKELRERFEPGARAMPNTISGMAALANERIENAIARGQFKNIPRGPGVERDRRADNPFIDTTEYIMNKMIQRQDLVPPWIEKQQELSKTIRVFRARLRNNWKRHVARTIAARGGSLEEKMRRAEQYAKAEEVHNPRAQGGGKTNTPPTPETKPASSESKDDEPTPTPESKPAEFESGPLPPPFRDASWERAEKAYLELAIKDLNRLTRSYNLMAPDLAKKGYYSLERELRMCFADVAPEVAREIQVRALSGNVRSRGLRGGGEGTRGDGGLMDRLSGGTKVQVHVEAEEKAYGLKQWWRDVWKKE